MQATQPKIVFEGTAEERQLVERLHDVARSQARYFPSTAPIRLRREDVIAFLVSRPDASGTTPEALGLLLDAALAKNTAAFARAETDDGVVTFITTRNGSVPVAVVEDQAHTLVKRLMDPIAAPPPPPPVPRKVAPMIAEGWSQRPNFADLADEPDFELEMSLAATPGIPALEPEPQGAVDVLVAAAPLAGLATPAPSPEPLGQSEPPTLASAVGTVPEAAVTPAPTATPVSAVAPAPEVAPAVEVRVAPVTPSFPSSTDAELRAALTTMLEREDRVVSFGDRYFAEDMVDRYSRGDLRRIREYILEVNEPLADDQLLQDLFSRRPNDPSYEAARFSINYRLSREKREFEFVGTRDSRLWSTTGLAPLGTTLRKASELGTDYRYLLDEPGIEATSSSVNHILTFFEWAYGLLPLDGTLRQFFPQTHLEEQKTATIRFEVPQLYVTFLAELRYPTINRGGYLVGLDEFYRENLTPGAIMTIERAPNNDGQFVIRYGAGGGVEERVLQIDERRNRYVFRPHALIAQVDSEWLLSEGRYPRLANLKPLDDKERRRSDTVVGTAFERVAENVGTKAQPRYWSTPEELLPIANIERPFSANALREVLDLPQYVQFTADPDTPGAYFYEPPAKAKAAGSKKRSAQVQEEDADDATDATDTTDMDEEI